MNARQVPNLVTFSRLGLAVVVFFFLERMLDADTAVARQHAAYWAFWLYAVAASTDFLDGWLARRFGWVTALGRISDPVVDKLLTLGALVYLAILSHKDLLAENPYLATERDFGQVMPAWAVVVVLGREFLVTAVRGYVEKLGYAFGADWAGKLKMALQTVYILILIGAAGMVPETIGLTFLIHLRGPWIVAVLFWGMIALTVLSGLNYCVRALHMLREPPSA